MMRPSDLRLSLPTDLAELVAATPVLAGTGKDVRAWLGALKVLKAKVDPAPQLTDPGFEAMQWEAWEERVHVHLTGSGEGRHSPSYGDLLFAAARRAPNAWFRDDLAAMTVSDWSHAVLACLHVALNRPWVVVAALRALGFGHPLLGRVTEWIDANPSLWMHWPGEAGAIRRFLEGVPERPPGLLVIAFGDGGVAASRPTTAIRPVFALEVQYCELYSRQLALLGEWGAFEVVIDEV